MCTNVGPVSSLLSLDYFCFTPANTGFNNQSQQPPPNQVLPVTTNTSHNSSASVNRERCKKRKQRWRSCCSLALSRLEMFVVTLICNPASSHIRSQPFWKGRRAPFYLRLQGASPEKCILSWTNKWMSSVIYSCMDLKKVPNEMLGYVPNTGFHTKVIISGLSLASRPPCGQLLLSVTLQGR